MLIKRPGINRIHIEIYVQYLLMILICLFLSTVFENIAIDIFIYRIQSNCSFLQKSELCEVLMFIQNFHQKSRCHSKKFFMQSDLISWGFCSFFLKDKKKNTTPIVIEFRNPQLLHYFALIRKMSDSCQSVIKQPALILSPSYKIFLYEWMSENEKSYFL
jgi:hypothetical protein